MDVMEYYKSKLSHHKNPKIHHLARVVYSDYLLLLKCQNGWCTCVTCWSKLRWDNPQMHPWHYRGAWSSLKWKFVDDNVRPQCYSCNVWKDGNYRNYKIFIDKTMWVEWEDMVWNDKETMTIKNRQYADMIKEWRAYILWHKDLYLPTEGT